jgi:hypothetical protein
MMEMKNAAGLFLEADMMYGQRSIGKVISTYAGSLTGAGTLGIEPAEWASALWAGMDGMDICFFSTRAAGATLRNSAATTVTSVDLDAKTITIAERTAIVAGDFIFWGTTPNTTTNTSLAQFDGTNFNSMVGLDMMANNATGTLFNISSTTYSLWRPNIYAISGQLDFPALSKAMAKSRAKGAKGNFRAIVSPTTWTDLLQNEVALRRHNVSQTTLENGAEALKFHAVTGSIEIVPHTLCKEGFAYIVNPKYFKRIGSADLTFDMSKLGIPGGQIFRHQNDNAGVETRCYSHQALFTTKLGHITTITGIVNAA